MDKKKKVYKEGQWVRVTKKMFDMDKLCRTRDSLDYGYYLIDPAGCYRKSLRCKAVWDFEKKERL